MLPSWKNTGVELDRQHMCRFNERQPVDAKTRSILPLPTCLNAGKLASFKKSSNGKFAARHAVLSFWRQSVRRLYQRTTKSRGVASIPSSQAFRRDFKSAKTA